MILIENTMICLYLVQVIQSYIPLHSLGEFFIDFPTFVIPRKTNGTTIRVIAPIMIPTPSLTIDLPWPDGFTNNIVAGPDDKFSGLFLTTNHMELVVT